MFGLEKLAARISVVVLLVVATMQTRMAEVVRGPQRERGDINMQHVIWAAFGVTVAVVITAVILSRVNEELPTIGGKE